MKDEQGTTPQYEREPFFKRVWSDIKDWFIIKGQSIKTRFLTYIKSKDTWKMWKRRLIVVGIIVLIALSFRVKEFFNLYPFDETSYLNIAEDRLTLNSYDGGSGYARLKTFISNFNGKVADAVRMHMTVSSYTVYEDLEFDGKNTLTLTIDNTKNKMLDKEERVKKIIQFNSIVSVMDGGFRIYKLIGDDGDEYILAKEAVYPV